MSPSHILSATFLLCLFCIHQISAQAPVLCDTAGCLNGECLQPPAVPTPVCNCSTGFQVISDPNICEDINECSESIFKCGFSYAYHHKQYKKFPHYGYPLFKPSGRCVNYPGGFYCLCYPPNRPTYRYDYCITPRRRQQKPLNRARNLRLLDQLEIIDL